MKVDLLFDYEEECYIVETGGLDQPPRILKAKVQKIFCNISPARVHIKTPYEINLKYACVYHSDVGSEHLITVDNSYMFKTRPEAVDKAKRIINTRYHESMKQLEEV